MTWDVCGGYIWFLILKKNVIYGWLVWKCVFELYNVHVLFKDVTPRFLLFYVKMLVSWSVPGSSVWPIEEGTPKFLGSSFDIIRNILAKERHICKDGETNGLFKNCHLQFRGLWTRIQLHITESKFYHHLWKNDTH